MTTLGIDIGTTAVAAVIQKKGDQHWHASRIHDAGRPQADGRCEQDPQRILEALEQLLAARPAVELNAVGITGQMHGVMAWDADGKPTMPLITWQDQRCDDAFLQELAERGLPGLHRGYGLATLAALDERPSGMVGTVMDWLVYRLCGRWCMDRGNAHSWGNAGSEWSAAAHALVDLPELLPMGTMAALSRGGFLGLPDGLPVTAACGDNQASILATCGSDDIALSLGTSAQLSLICEHPPEPLPEGCELRPFLDDSSLLVRAGLCGGAAWCWLADALTDWLPDLGLQAPARGALLDRLDELACSATDTVAVNTAFLGERHAPQMRGSIAGLTLPPPGLGSLARGFAEGIIRGLADSLPSSLLAGRRRIVGSGNALGRNRALQKAAEEFFGLSLHLSGIKEEAAHGAAVLAELRV